MPDHLYLPSPDNANPRTEAALARLRTAMADIEADIAAHRGVYPFNHGRVTQSELCRRADVKKATLQTPLHKDTTRIQILAWLDTLTAGLTVTRDATRQKVTAAADQLAVQVQQLESELQAAFLQLGLAQQRIATLEGELARSLGLSFALAENTQD
jgi:RecJ-like exonuclease